MAEEKAIIFFDGVCNLCNGFVQFVIRNDKKALFRFASLQSEEALPYLQHCDLDATSLNTVVLWEDGKCYDRSTAALRILKKLSAPWPVFYATIIIPKGLRNGVYDLISRNRYKWFGKQDSCMLPTPELKSRFL